MVDSINAHPFLSFSFNTRDCPFDPIRSSTTPRRTFNLCNDTSLEDQSARIMFAGDGVVNLPIQENDPSCNGTVCNIKGVCGIMTDYGSGSEASSKPSEIHLVRVHTCRIARSNGGRCCRATMGRGV